LPLLMSSKQKFKNIFEYISSFSAALILAVILMDFIPHITKESCDPSDTRYNPMANWALLASGISFIGLIGLDNLLLNHSHCDSEQISREQKDCIKKDDECLKKHDHLEMHHEKAENVFSFCNSSSFGNSTSKSQAVIFVLAISFHSFLEGLVVKTGATYKLEAYDVALVVHKILESFGLSLSIHTTSFSKTTKFLLCLLFSSLTPLGMFLGGVFAGFKKVLVVFNGMALGSMFFIVFVEMVPSLFHHQKRNFKKWLVFLNGFLISAFVIWYTHLKSCGQNNKGSSNHVHGPTCNH